ncbi:MAG TPA: LptF/LptG family permease, partial [Albitalea sp.]|nr:LptF/LptG family permease [Albitalea sp.]
MKTVRRLFYADIVSSVGFVALAFLSLFFFIDFVEELADVGKRSNYTALHAAAYSLLELPGHVYELMPIAVLIGTIYALARLAQSSEYTILRTGGLGPGRALSLLTSLALAFGALTFVVGDYLTPLAEEAASNLQARFKGGLKLGRSGAWLKDRQIGPNGERSFSINVGSAGGGGVLRDIRIFEFDASGRLLQRISATNGLVDKHAVWTLLNVTITRWAPDAPSQAPAVAEQTLPQLVWPSTLSASVVAAAVLPLGTMSTLELLRYIDHLADNE